MASPYILPSLCPTERNLPGDKYNFNMVLRQVKWAIFRKKILYDVLPHAKVAGMDYEARFFYSNGKKKINLQNNE